MLLGFDMEKIYKLMNNVIRQNDIFIFFSRETLPIEVKNYQTFFQKTFNDKQCDYFGELGNSDL